LLRHDIQAPSQNDSRGYAWDMHNIGRVKMTVEPTSMGYAQPSDQSAARRPQVQPVGLQRPSNQMHSHALMLHNPPWRGVSQHQSGWQPQVQQRPSEPCSHMTTHGKGAQSCHAPRVSDNRRGKGNGAYNEPPSLGKTSRPQQPGQVARPSRIPEMQPVQLEVPCSHTPSPGQSTWEPPYPRGMPVQGDQACQAQAVRGRYKRPTANDKTGAGPDWLRARTPSPVYEYRDVRGSDDLGDRGNR